MENECKERSWESKKNYVTECYRSVSSHTNEKYEKGILGEIMKWWKLWMWRVYAFNNVKCKTWGTEKDLEYWIYEKKLIAKNATISSLFDYMYSCWNFPDKHGTDYQTYFCNYYFIRRFFFFLEWKLSLWLLTLYTHTHIISYMAIWDRSTIESPLSCTSHLFYWAKEPRELIEEHWRNLTLTALWSYCS